MKKEVYSTKVEAKEKISKMAELVREGYSISGENDNGDGTFTIFFRESDE
jgi:hypothetical protein